MYKKQIKCQAAAMGPNPKSIHLNGSQWPQFALEDDIVIKKITSVVVLTNKSKWKAVKFPTLTDCYTD